MSACRYLQVAEKLSTKPKQNYSFTIAIYYDFKKEGKYYLTNKEV